MVEPFSIATGAIQVAGAGFQLAKILYDYLNTVKNAQKHIKAIATEVRLASSVLEHLSALLGEHETEKLCSKNITSDAKAAFCGCEDAFREVEETFKVLIMPQREGSKAVSLSGRLSWPFKKGKLEALQANLERLKTTLLLMLSVLGYAKDKAAKSAVHTTQIAIERLQIENLIKAKEDATERYENLIHVFSQLETTETTFTRSTPQEPHTNDRESHNAATGRVLVSLPIASSSRNKFHDRTVNSDNTLSIAGAPDSKSLLIHLHRCSSAVSKLTSAINAASLDVSMSRRFKPSNISESLKDLETGVFQLLSTENSQRITNISEDKERAKFATRQGTTEGLANDKEAEAIPPGWVVYERGRGIRRAHGLYWQETEGPSGTGVLMPVAQAQSSFDFPNLLPAGPQSVQNIQSVQSESGAKQNSDESTTYSSRQSGRTDREHSTGGDGEAHDKRAGTEPAKSFEDIFGQGPFDLDSSDEGDETAKLEAFDFDAFLNSDSNEAAESAVMKPSMEEISQQEVEPSQPSNLQPAPKRSKHPNLLLSPASALPRGRRRMDKAEQVHYRARRMAKPDLHFRAAQTAHRCPQRRNISGLSNTGNDEGGQKPAPSRSTALNSAIEHIGALDKKSGGSKAENEALATTPSPSPLQGTSKNRKRRAAKGDETDEQLDHRKDSGVPKAHRVEEPWSMESVDDLVKRWTTVEV